VQKTFLVNEENKNTLISLIGKDIAFKKFLFSSSEIKKKKLFRYSIYNAFL